MGVTNTYNVTLLVHQEEAVIVLAEKVKSRFDILRNVRDLSDLFWFVVVAQGAVGGD